MRRTPNDYINFWPGFTDILTSAFVFFIFIAVLLILKNVFDLQELYSLKAYKEDIEKKLLAFRKEFPESTTVIQNNEIKIVLNKENNGISFKSDKSDINSIESAAGIESLENIGNLVKIFLDRNGGKKQFGIVIEGYTDRVESEEYNYNLSYNRAKNIMLYWWDKCGLDPNYYDINPVGYGELWSKLAETTQDGVSSEKNRRIEIRLSPKFGEMFREKTDLKRKY